MTFQYKGEAKHVAENIVRMFEQGNIAKPLGRVFLNVESHVPMYRWSLNNVLNCLFADMSDARTFKQWLAVDRCVRKGEKSPASILIPYFAKKDKDDPESPQYLTGFGTCAVFDVAQTDGEPLPDNPITDIINNRPLIEVAKHWGLDVTPMVSNRAAGSYDRKTIRLSVADVSTWLHELVHAADDRAGNLTELTNNLSNEAVAELGSATLATMIGEENVDTGKAYNYIKMYADKEDVGLIDACTQALHRVATAVGLIMDEAAKLGLMDEFFATTETEPATVVV